MDDRDGSAHPDPGKALRALAGRLAWARLALLWERLWPAIVPPLCTVALLLALAWTGAGQALPDPVRLALAWGLVAALLASLVPLLRLRWPSHGEALARIERDSGFTDRPLTALSDRLAIGTLDPMAKDLWQLHRIRLARRVAAARVGLPSPRVDRRDPYVLRAGALLIFVIGLSALRGDPLSPVADLYSWPTAGPSDPPRIDVVATPPAYTGRPATVLSVSGDVARVPAGSQLAVRITGDDQPTVAFQGKAGPATALAATGGGGDAPRVFGAALTESGTVLVTVGSSPTPLVYPVAVVPDQPPSIRLTEDPSTTARGALRLVYDVSDDWRVASARAIIEAAAATEGGEEAARPLVAPPEFPLVLPRRGKADTTAETTRDLSAHPLAGGPVRLILEARDDAGHVTRSLPVTLTLPSRRFRDPVARMLVEQRRHLAGDARQAGEIADILAFASLQAAVQVDDASVVLGLSVAADRLAAARNDDDLRAMLDFLWSMATIVETGDTAQAEQRLTEARDRLREALQNGASAEEIARLTQELREAMREFLEASRRNAEQDPDLSGTNPEGGREVTPEDLADMVDRIDELSQLGDREAAEQLLSELDEILENLGEPGRRQQGSNGQAGQMMDELADIIRRQQELMNQTHRRAPGGSESGEGSTQEREEAMGDLREGQEGLGQKLDDLIGRMRRGGLEPGNELGDAGRSMQGAGRDLERGDPGAALGRQGEALDALRRGAEQLARQLDGEGEGEGQRSERNGGTDPLGRPRASSGEDRNDSVRIPGEIDVQRARRILDELRRRFSDDSRPAPELDYLRRLLEPF